MRLCLSELLTQAFRCYECVQAFGIPYECVQAFGMQKFFISLDILLISCLRNLTYRTSIKIIFGFLIILSSSDDVTRLQLK